MNATLPAGYDWIDTYAVNSSDTAAALASDKKTRTAPAGRRNSNRARYAIIQPLTNGIKWTLGATPVTGAGNLGVLAAANTIIELKDAGAVDNFKFVSAVSGQAAAVQVTLGF